MENTGKNIFARAEKADCLVSAAERNGNGGCFHYNVSADSARNYDGKQSGVREAGASAQRGLLQYQL